MKLERHVGGLGRARQLNYLTTRGWSEASGLWTRADLEDPLKLPRALHCQLTEDLSKALAALGWSVVDYSPRGYVRLKDGRGQVPDCSLPKALRVQARREGRLVGELTYSLFLAALLPPQE